MNSGTRVLIVLGGSMNFGGTENFLMNYYRHMDKQIVQYDFVCQGDERGVYDAEILNMGGKIFHIPYKLKHPVLYTKELQRIIVEGKYRIVHAQMDAMNAWPLWVAKKCGVPYRISHSHNMDLQSNSPLKRILNLWAMRQIPKVATALWACSTGAAEWLYGKANAEKAIIIKNAIDTEKFAFNIVKRQKVREQYNIKNEFVIGHVGRLSYQKNHEFILLIFKEILKINKNSKLLLVGDGELHQQLVQLAAKLKISDSVIFAGNQRNISDYYSAMDVFLFPSFFEGLSVTLLEAQCNGLHCVCSDRLSEESDVTGIDKLSLNLPAEKWAEVVIKYKDIERIDGVNKLREQGFDINKEAKILQAYYERK